MAEYDASCAVQNSLYKQSRPPREFEVSDRVCFWRQLTQKQGASRGRQGSYALGTLLAREPNSDGSGKHTNAWMSAAGRVRLVSREQLRLAQGSETWVPSQADTDAMRRAEMDFEQGQWEGDRAIGGTPRQKESQRCRSWRCRSRKWATEEMGGPEPRSAPVPEHQLSVPPLVDVDRDLIYERGDGGRPRLSIGDMDATELEDGDGTRSTPSGLSSMKPPLNKFNTSRDGALAVLCMGAFGRITWTAPGWGGSDDVPAPAWHSVNIERWVRVEEVTP